MNNLEELAKIPYNDLKRGLVDAVIEHDVDELKYLLKHPLIQEESKFQNFMDITFSLACKNSDNIIVDLLLNSSEFKLNADINCDNGEPLIKAAENDDLDMIKYLTTHPKFIINRAIPDDSVLFSACLKGNIEIIDYFYTQPNLKKHFDFLTGCNNLLMIASEHGQLEVAKYLLNSPKLKEEISDSDIEKAFKKACYKKQFNIIEYFIFDSNIEKTPSIESYLEHNGYFTVQSLFEKRDLNKELNNSLNQNNPLMKKAKL